VRDNVPHGDPNSVLHEKTLEEIIEELIRADNKVTRAQMAEKIGVSVKTIARKLKEMKHIAFVGSGNNGHWEIKE
jgi:ATP-dependent DNA helicase RecG